MNRIIFSHGKESGPWGTKITALAKVACGMGWAVESIDYRATFDPDERVRMLLEGFRPGPGKTVLAGSSMGGYVATVASAAILPAGLFLMAPAFYLPGYRDQDPTPRADRTVLVHGWHDPVVSAENALRFACRHRAELHLVDSGHTLVDRLPLLEKLLAEVLFSVGGRGESLAPHL